MKLKVRYDESVQTIDLDAEATEQLWVSLSLEGEDLTQKERERMIQDAFEEQFNRPDYTTPGTNLTAIVGTARRSPVRMTARMMSIHLNR